MIYAEILAGGKGTRMGNVNMPKQFLSLHNKPVIIHTLEKFILNPDFDKIIVVSPREWMNYTNDIIQKYIGKNDRLVVVEGGKDRNESIMSGIRYIEDTVGLFEDDYIVTHDSVRPFLTHRIIKENIEMVKKHKAVDTVIEAIDTIIESEDGDVISQIPKRSMMYQGQTPQSFHIKTLVALYNQLTEAQKQELTDACKICSLSGVNVKIVKGEVFNIKITTPYDLKVANAIIQENIAND
ncbi:2-C-methyl-D-erythritol 4-phosphate cytidylyltransferase [Heyndrickxia coagulans]|uniref:IspD/TarI family cytidylyltransferase n=1 Tax=Heyndrickxia coagulans TaxID=1398 RepID=UPI001F358CC8|nr:2-C-methyl-D-erythritol 4-phosphate cytidylyltransferase [Heyndrickxia coagulans]UJZ87819.1 2-C-methyl-D-erythritol 4-phosphate cytidylyltransferase [Heyndrickxia coagulans]